MKKNTTKTKKATKTTKSAKSLKATKTTKTTKNAKKELSKAQRKSCSGGGMPSNITYMKCSNCGHRACWAGNFIGITCECPRCGRNTFIGREKYT